MPPVWQKICEECQSCHSWQETGGSKIAAMTLIAALIFFAMIVGILLERNNRHYAGQRRTRRSVRTRPRSDLCACSRLDARA